jgi:hypothetical protein
MSISRATSVWVADRATFGVSCGKWYWEYTSGASGSGFEWTGIGNASATLANYVGADANGYAYGAYNGNKINSGVNSGNGVAYGATYVSGDVIGIAVNVDSANVSFYKNNTFINTQTFATVGISTANWFFYVQTSAGSANGQYTANFGQQPFVYTPPSGFVALNAFNM